MRIADLPVGPVIPVSDLPRSLAFYEGLLGLPGEPVPGGHVLWCGRGTRIFLLPEPAYAGRAEWPLASLHADDLPAVVAELRVRGVELESFADGPQQTDERGIATLDDTLIAWIRDPDGQVLSLFQPA